MQTHSIPPAAHSLVLTPAVMESSIIHRLEIVEEEIFAVVASDESSVAFAERWTTLQQDIDQALQAGHLSCETQALAFRIASNVKALAESFLESEQERIALSAKLTADLNVIFAQVCFWSN